MIKVLNKNWRLIFYTLAAIHSYFIKSFDPSSSMSQVPVSVCIAVQDERPLLWSFDDSFETFQNSGTISHLLPHKNISTLKIRRHVWNCMSLACKHRPSMKPIMSFTPTKELVTSLKRKERILFEIKGWFRSYLALTRSTFRLCFM